MILARAGFLWIFLAGMVACGARSESVLDQLSPTPSPSATAPAKLYVFSPDDALCMQTANEWDCCKKDGCAPAIVQCETGIHSTGWFGCLSVDTLMQPACDCPVDRELLGLCIDNTCKPVGAQCKVPSTNPDRPKEVCGFDNGDGGNPDFDYATCVPPCRYLEGDLDVWHPSQ